tara:strand:+ start:153 stop:401 length:249 start_codon:yes stop_codon:yes gene_type:complete
MAKKTRIDRRGTIRPLVTRFPPVAKLHWQKQKLLAMLANRKQWQRDFDPSETAAYEIEIEQGGYYIITEASSSAVPNYIITE